MACQQDTYTPTRRDVGECPGCGASAPSVPTDTPGLLMAGLF